MGLSHCRFSQSESPPLRLWRCIVVVVATTNMSWKTCWASNSPPSVRRFCCCCYESRWWYYHLSQSPLGEREKFPSESLSCGLPGLHSFTIVVLLGAYISYLIYVATTIPFRNKQPSHVCCERHNLARKLLYAPSDSVLYPNCLSKQYKVIRIVVC